MKKLLKWVAIIFVVLVVVGMFAGGEGSDGKATANKAREVVKIGAADLFKAYEANEVATDERFKGKDIVVSGTVQSIDKDAFDNIIINFRTSNEYMPARMQMKDTEKAAAIALKKGVKSSVQCRRMSRIIGSPAGNDCIFVAGS